MMETATKVASATLDAMKSTPLAIALLVVNVGFLGFAAFVLHRALTTAGITNIVVNPAKLIKIGRNRRASWG